MKNSSKGFTLIELLVVIAIIGILAALVLVALNNARDKANDAKIKSDVGQLRTIAEIIYDSGSASYAQVDDCMEGPSATTCLNQSTADSVTTLRADLDKANAGQTTPAALQVNANASDYCVSALLLSGNHVCVDATGTFTEGTGATCGTTATACP